MGDEALWHLDARARAFPLRCEHAYRQATRLLDSDLRARAEIELVQHGRGRSRDTARLIVERAWRATADCTPPMEVRDHISAWALDLLEPRGDGHGLRVGPSSSPGEASLDLPSAVLRWRWATLFVPKALLVGAAPGPAANGTVFLAPPTLGQLLREERWAELHLHAAASRDFDQWWLALLVDAGPSPSASDARRIALRMAALLRLLLHSALRLRQVPRRLVHEALDWRGRWVVGRWLDGALSGEDPGENDLDAHFPPLASALGFSPRRFEGAAWLPPTELDAATELPDAYRDEVTLVRDYYCAAPRLLEEDGAEIDRLFWQYQRLRARFQSRVVHTPGVAGLDEFREKYRGIGTAGLNEARTLFQRSTRLQSGRLRLQALEVRPSMPRRGALTRHFAAWAQSAAMSNQAGAGVELGLVVSLIKPSTPHPGRPTGGSVRFAKTIGDLSAQVDGIEALLVRVPELLLLLRGVDVASAELGAPTWVVAPFLRALREASIRASCELSEGLAPSLGVPPLRITVHAGEEYRSPLSGLRTIDELIETGVLLEGDRIGHGLALGFDVSRLRGRPFLQPREERVFDLLWELDLVERRLVDISGGRVHALRAEVRRLLSPLGDRDFAEAFADVPRQLLAADGDRLRRWGISPPSGPTALARYLGDARAYLCLSAPIEVSLDEDDLRIAEAIRLAMVNRVAAMELVVEANPTSNLLIGDLGSVAEHPAFRLSPVGESPRVGVVICDDDPLTFATCLADEVAYIYAALRRQPNLPAQTALAWIDRARQTAWRARFTIERSALPAALEDLAERMTV